MRCLASTQGPKVRVNAVLPGLLLTEWGQLYGEAMVKVLEERAWLKKVVGFSPSLSSFFFGFWVFRSVAWPGWGFGGGRVC